MDAFYKSLASVINTSKKRAKELVANYNTGDLGFFKLISMALNLLSLWNQAKRKILR